MLWKFSFASGSTLESLFTRETPPTVEEVMDESDVLNECKAQNQRYVLAPSSSLLPSCIRDSAIARGEAVKPPECTDYIA
jgi:hypothetical protein